MKNYIVFVLLCVPVVAFAVPSVRVLGNANTPSTSATSVKMTPAKAVTGAVSSGTSETTASRVGTVRAKTTTGTVSKTKSNTGSESRFPVIMPNHVYNSVVSPKPSGGTTVINAEVDTDAIKAEVMNEVENSYYNKTEVNNIIKELKEDDDPRIDAIKIGKKPVHKENLPGDYVYMWLED